MPINNSKSLPQCPNCKAPIPNFGPVRRHILNCSICRHVYIPDSTGIILLEDFLDPEGILDLSNVDGFSPAFQDLYTRDIKLARLSKETYQKSGVMVDNLHTFEPWERLMKQKVAQNDLEEAMFCALQGMKDYSWSNLFWGTLGIYFTKICYHEAAIRCCSMLRKLVQPPYPVDQICQMVLEIKPAIQQLYPHSSQKQINAIVLSFNGMYSLNNHRMSRGKKLIDRAMRIDPQNYEVYRQLGSYYWIKNDFKNAIKAVKKSIHINPKNPRTQEFLRQIMTDQASQKRR